MGDGTEENPFTREDVVRLIEEHGGTAKGLDLSGKQFEDKVDLRGQNLHGIILRDASLEHANLERTDLTGAHLEGAFLPDIHLEAADLEETHFERAWLMGAHLEGAYLGATHLEGANLQYAHFEDSLLDTIELSNDTRLENAHWGNYVVSWEIEDYLIWAISVYRQLKTWHTNAGIYHTAGEFFFREMTVKRKMLQWWPKPWNRAFSKLLSILCGYGERPLRVVVSAVVVVFGLAAVYYLFGGLTVPYSLYYSAVSFTALGYGRWVDIMPQGWVQAFGAAESFIGVFMLALFLITFVRKMAR